MKHFKLKRFLLVAVFATFLCNVCWADDATYTYIDNDVYCTKDGEKTNVPIQYTYTINEDGESVTITGILVSSDYTNSYDSHSLDITIPAQIEGKRVTALSTTTADVTIFSLYGPNFLLYGSITIPEGVETLGSNCFNYVGYTSINIPTTVKTFGYRCFAYSGADATITFDNITSSQLESIGDECFSDAKLSFLTIPMPKLTHVGSNVVLLETKNKTKNPNMESVIFVGAPAKDSNGNVVLSSDDFTSLLKNLSRNAKKIKETGFADAFFPIEYISDYENLFKVDSKSESATTFSYRITSARYSTVSLPYTLKPASDCLGIAKFYEEKEDGGLNANKTEITFSEPTSMTQGKPYVFEQASANADGEDFAPQSQFGITGFVAFALSDPTETAATEVHSGTYLKGTFSDMKYNDLNGNENCYLLQSGVFKKWADSGAWLDAYRAYLDLSAASNSSNSKAGRVTINFEDSEATGIAEVKTETVKDNRMFDLQGRRITRPVSGQLYIKNGQKYIAR